MDIFNEGNFTIAHELIFSNCDNRSDPAGTLPECTHVPFREESGMYQG